MGGPPELVVVVRPDFAAATATVRVCGEVDIATATDLRPGLGKAVASGLAAWWQIWPPPRSSTPPGRMPSPGPAGPSRPLAR